jgi:uncharacterized protein YjbI with pentapeptide repeats
MANEEHLAILRQGVQVWNEWRKDNHDVWPDLRGADLSGVDLSGTNLNWAGLIYANLRYADLKRANLSAADLSSADLSGTHFNGANLSGAHLAWANLTGADLSGADLSSADLDGADFADAHSAWTLFANIDLSRVSGLETVVHDGPSTIGIDTIYLSKGKIAEVFFHGCGVPDEMITFMHSLVAASAIQFYSCFISYSTKDEDFAKRLHADLQAHNVRCWFAPEDVQGGKKLHEQIDEAIRYHDKLLLILSENSMGSEWVKTEIRRARKQEVKAGQRKLFPISLVPFDAIRAWEAFDADIGKDMAVEVREYFVPDFSCWKDHDAYKRAFDRLLRDLKAEPG